MSKCTDCGHPLNRHDGGFCCYVGCERTKQCAHNPLRFDASFASGRWEPAVADATGDAGAQQKKLRVLIAYGTRPEKIKLAPVADALRASGVEVVEWFSGQSKDLVPGGDPEDRWRVNATYGIARTMIDFDQFFRDDDPPHAVVVQGDTATAFACAQAAFLARVPVAHVEAGLRTYESEPWPEETFRRQIGAVAKWHFTPDEDAAKNLMREIGVNDYSRAKRGVFVVGNTVIDTLPKNTFRVLVTLHRRENWGERIEQALWTLAQFANEHYKDVEVTPIRHPNWSQHQNKLPVKHAPHFAYFDPMERDDLLAVLRTSDLIVTDSGGLQEEAAHFGIDCLVLRTSTERVALARSGAVELIDPDSPSALRDALEAKLARRRAYGSGDAGKRIAEILVAELTSLDSEREEA